MHELQLALELSQKTARSVQEDRDRYSLQLQEYKAAQLEEVEKLKNRVVTAEAAKDGAEKRLSHLIQEIDKKEGAVRIAEQAVEDCRKSADLARRALTSAESQLLSLRVEHSKELEDMTISHTSERAHLLEIHDAMTEKLRDREEALRKAMRDVSEVQARTEANESNLRRNHAAIVSTLKKRLSQLEIELSDSTAKYHGLQAENSRYVEEADVHANVLKADVSRLKREKDILHDKVRELEQEVDIERRKNAGLRRDLSSRKDAAEADLNEEKSRLRSAEEELTPLRTQLVEVTARCAMIEGKFREALAANASLQDDAKSKITALQKTFKERLDSVKGSLKANLVRERKRGDAYKEKALQAHNRSKSSGQQ